MGVAAPSSVSKNRSSISPGSDVSTFRDAKLGDVLVVLKKLSIAVYAALE